MQTDVNRDLIVIILNFFLNLIFEQGYFFSSLSLKSVPLFLFCSPLEESDTTSDFTFTFHFHALEKEMATHSSVLAWRIPGMVEPGGLLSMRSRRVRHD